MPRSRNSIRIIDHDLNIKTMTTIPGEDEFLERGTAAEPLPHHLEVVVSGRENLEAGQLADTCRGERAEGRVKKLDRSRVQERDKCESVEAASSNLQGCLRSLAGCHRHTASWRKKTVRASREQRADGGESRKSRENSG